MLTSNPPIKVCCVVSDFDLDLNVEKVSEFTYKTGIDFTMRLYNSRKYSDDMSSIKSLPAFHVYIKNGYRDTLHLDDDLFNTINKYKKEYETKKPSFMKGLKKLFLRNFK